MIAASRGCSLCSRELTMAKSTATRDTTAIRNEIEKWLEDSMVTALRVAGFVGRTSPTNPFHPVDVVGVAGGATLPRPGRDPANRFTVGRYGNRSALRRCS